MDIFEEVRKGSMLFLLSLPIVLMNILAFFTIAFGNLGMLSLFFGHAIFVPLLVFILRIFTYMLTTVKPGLKSWVYVGSSDIGQLVPSAVIREEQFNVAPSYWVAHVVFFFSYLFSNALDIYNLPPASEAATEEWRVENRKARATMIMTFSVGILLALLYVRYKATKLETKFGLFVGLATVPWVAYGFYRLMTLAGVRKMDIFGIVQQMVPVTEDRNITYCVAPPS